MAPRESSVCVRKYEFGSEYLGGAQDFIVGFHTVMGFKWNSSLDEFQQNLYFLPSN